MYNYDSSYIVIFAFFISCLSKYFLMFLIFLSPSKYGVKLTLSSSILLNPKVSNLSMGIYLSTKSNAHFPSKSFL